MPERAGLVGLCFNRTVDRELVHRRSLSEVLLTDALRVSDGVFLIGAQWPRWHVFYGSIHDGYNSALIAETLRQATIMTAHSMLEVPLDRRFLLSSMTVSRNDTDSVPDLAAEAGVTLQLLDVHRSAGSVSKMVVQAEFVVDGEPVATGTAKARIVGEGTYARLRGLPAAEGTFLETARLPARQVGHTSRRNVVLGVTSGQNRWPLLVDASNPIFFDHPLDHVPGALLIEAARQAVRAGTGCPDRDLASFDSTFAEFVELTDESEVVITDLVEDADSVSAVVEIRVGDQVAMTTRAVASGPNQA